MAFVKITEQPSLYDNLEKKSVLEILQDINTEDQKVALAVKKAIPQIKKLVSQIVPRMKQGGRIFYMGAGTSGSFAPQHDIDILLKLRQRDAILCHQLALRRNG